MRPTRRWIGFVALVVMIGGGAIAYGVSRPSAGALVMTVYMTRECGCCGEWVAHMKQGGFLVTTRYLPEGELWRVKDHHGLPPSVRSCHTAEVGGYVLEGHIPADAVRRVLRTRPDILAAAVPGMPLGSPGMEVPGRTPDRYDVIAVHRDGELGILERR